MPKNSVSHQGDEFQEWLRGELDARRWSHAKLAREIDVFKGTVGRWLAPPEESNFRRPSIESYRRLGEVFGVDPISIMRMAGVEGLDQSSDLSPIKRDIMSAVIAIPDDLLITVYPQLRALMDTHVQETIRQSRHLPTVSIAEGSGREP